MHSSYDSDDPTKTSLQLILSLFMCENFWLTDALPALVNLNATTAFSQPPFLPEQNICIHYLFTSKHLRKRKRKHSNEHWYEACPILYNCTLITYRWIFVIFNCNTHFWRIFGYHKGTPATVKLYLGQSHQNIFAVKMYQSYFTSILFYF